MKKYIALVLALLMLAMPLAACKDNESSDSGKGGADTSQSTSAGTGAADTEAEEVNTDVYTIPEKFAEGVTFEVLTPQVIAANYAIVDFDEPSDDAYSNAIYQRNLAVEEYLGCTIHSTEGTDFKDVYNRFKTSVDASSGEYDAVFNNMSNTCSAVGGGLCVPFDEMANINLDNSWWNADCTEQLAIGGSHYMISGDIALSDKECIWAVYFTKDMILENRLEDPYQLVKDNKWTWDKMHEMARTAANELSGDDVIDQSDIWGVTTHSENWTAMWQSAGLKLAELDEYGVPYPSWGTEQFVDVFADIADFMGDATCVSPDDDKFIAVAFPEGRTLFATEVIAHVRNYRNNDYDFGIVPFPKYDASQKEYLSYIADYSNVLTVGMDNPDIDMTSAILETMGKYGKEILTPAYYEDQIKSRFARDETTWDMLDIIFTHRSYDLGVFFNWGGAYNSLKSKDASPATLYRSLERSIERDIQKSLGALGLF